MGGIDMGDHPPITPVAMATESSVGGGDDWRIYEYVARHFLGTVSADCAYLRSRAGFAAAGEEFTATGDSTLQLYCHLLTTPLLPIPKLFLPTHMTLVFVVEMAGAFVNRCVALPGDGICDSCLPAQQSSFCSCWRGFYCYR
jgi:hypothetical protein